MSEVDIKENAEGDLSLLDNHYEKKFSKEQIKYWFDEIKKLHPHMDNMLIIRALDAYSTHPHIVDELMEEYRNDPDKFKLEQKPLEYPENWEEKLNE
jgi:hypothetical protein